MKPLGRWLAETRLGRWVFRAVMLSFLGLAAAGLIWFEVDQRTRPIIERIEVIERVEPVDLLRECLRTPECRRLFRHPELLQVERQQEQVEARQQDSGRDVSQPPSTGGQPPEPGVRPGGREDDDGEQPSQPRRPKAPAESPSPDTTPTSPAAPAPSPSSAPPAEAPGKSGETPAAEKSVEACVDLIVSACVGVPPLLP